MSLSVEKEFIPERRPNRPGTTIRPRSVTIHNTANPNPGADAKAHSRFVREKGYYELNGRPNPVSWHFTVDDRRAIQHLPLSERAFHAGRGNGSSVAIEICMHRGIDQAAANRRAAALAAAILHELGLPSTEVRTHQSWTGKRCPALLIGDRPWRDFLAMVAEEHGKLPAGTPRLASEAELNAMAAAPDQPDDGDDREIVHELLDLSSFTAEENVSQAEEPVLGALEQTLATLGTHLSSEAGQRLFPHGVDYLELSARADAERRIVIAGPTSRRSAQALAEEPASLLAEAFDSVPEDEADPADAAALAAAAPAVQTRLELPAPGLYGTHAADRRFGTERTILALLDVGARFEARHGLRIGIGDISRRGGGPISEHASHRRGVDVDVRPLRNDGREERVTFRDRTYSRELTQDLVELFRSNAVFPIKFVFFNDPRVAGVSPWPNHDNHLHVRFDLAR